MQYVIIGNFGNHSLAAMQALIEARLQGIHFIYVETGWAAAAWPARVAACFEYAQSHNISVHYLKSVASFTKMVKDRRQFPSQKFPWCAGFLKGLAIIDCLDEMDPACEAQVVFGKRRVDSRRYANLKEFDHHDELYQGRTVWYPLWQADNHQFLQLIHKTGFAALSHQSLECHPCIHMPEAELPSLGKVSRERLAKLEERLKQTMFAEPITAYPASQATACPATGLNLQQFERGCKASWGCGE